MIYKDYYKILDIETSRVTMDEIKVAYRRAAKKYHPDVNIEDNLAEERIKDINEAYRVLSVPASKRKYDRTWNAHHISQSQKKVNGKESIFSMFLGNVEKQVNDGPKQEPLKGENIETAIQVGLKECFFGKEKKISLKSVEGKLKTYTITIPAGIRNKEKIRLIGQGKEGKNGGKNGDLLIQIQIQDDSDFHLEGYHLYTNLLLSPWEAALGTRVAIKAIDSETNIYIPKGIQSGEKIKIPNHGYPDGKGGRGDLIAEIKIIVPKDLTKEEKNLYEKLKEISNFNPRDIQKSQLT